MDKKTALKSFISVTSKWNDYWEMQLNWECYIDGLARDGQITEKQRNNWGNPTTPEKFRNWNSRNYR